MDGAVVNSEKLSTHSRIILEVGIATLCARGTKSDDAMHIISNRCTLVT